MKATSSTYGPTVLKDRKKGKEESRLSTQGSGTLGSNRTEGGVKVLFLALERRVDGLMTWINI